MPISFTFTGDTVQEVFAQMCDALTGAGAVPEYRAVPSTRSVVDVYAATQDAYAAGNAPARGAVRTEIRANAFGAAEEVTSEALDQAVYLRAVKDLANKAADLAAYSTPPWGEEPAAEEPAPEQANTRAARASELAVETVRAYAEAEQALACAAEEPAAEAPAPERAPAEDTVKLLDYQTDVVPKVLDFVKRKGRDAAAAILGEFGVTNAKAMAPELWPELLERLS